ncbi:hypothetical protein ACQ9AR_06995 [Streptomyces lividans]|uniref:Uncharacterized protein n=3 Tax=Streptomyces lividans TaxID=1916 RepID=A0A7U9E0N6_STRLI|nr:MULTISPECIES: hypothetical protein [Streptomyces]ABP49137.1 hypothtical protein [Streptomyces lividans]AIJ12666.1 hypothetical protein SLIV_08270 [Streptomyces lividans TK24]EFD66020.1 hypothetical protein SSPG_01660 [Streptomyces lividans TK24]EOY51066.1 hypothetical protein SLI_6359 [Streptomyces lividans 1326]KKD17162.1 hypothetical protein TR66_02005 [Streptomyces sp. WM6391]
MHHETPPPTAASDPRRLQAALCSALGQRGLECTVEYDLSDYIVHAELPDGSSLIISPPQEPPSEHPESPESWMVTRHRSVEPAVYEVIYDSEPDGPHARHGGSVPYLLSAVDARLDQLGVPPRQEQERSGKARTTNVLPPDSAPSRASVALASSPSIDQRVLPTGPPTESSARAAPPPTPPSSAPRL